MKRLILLMLVLLISLSLFSQAMEDNFSNDIMEQTLTIDQDPGQLPTSQNLIADGVTRLLAALLTSVIALACFYIQKYPKIYINEKNVIGLITEKCVELKKKPISNDIKKELVIEHIEKNQKVSKWAKILYGSLGRAVDVIFQTVVKKKLSV